MENNSDKYLLAIESAISGGSIALFKGNKLLGESSGSDLVSRAEDLLPRLVDLLADADVERDKLSRIAISLGPGSYTGLRIGIATVMGLCRGLRIDYVGISLSDAIANHYGEGESVVAVPMGKSDICVLEPAREHGRITSLEGLKLELARRAGARLLAHSDIASDLRDIRPDVVDIGVNLAKLIGAAALDRPKSTSLDPIYIQNPRFG